MVEKEVQGDWRQEEMIFYLRTDRIGSFQAP